MIKLNRFGIAGQIFMLGLAVSAFVLLNAADVLARVQKENARMNRFKYNAVFRLEPADRDDFYLRAPEIAKELLGEIQKVSVGTGFYQLPVTLNNDFEFTFTEVVINAPEGLKLRDTDNNVINTDLPEGSNSVIIGESLLGELIDGALPIENIRIPIAGVLRNDNPAKIDYSLYIFYNASDEAFREYLNGRIAERLAQGFLEVDFFGDSPIEEQADRFIRAAESLGLRAERENIEFGMGYWGNNEQNLWYFALNSILLPLCIVFALITCFSASLMWISRRRKELSVRKAYGWGNIRIAALLTVDSIKLSVPSIFIALVMQFINCLIFNKLDFFDETFIFKLLFTCAGMALISALCALRQIKVIDRISPAEAVKYGG